MSPGEERAVWKMFGYIAEVIGHEHITERRDPCIRFEKLANAFERRSYVKSGRGRAGRAEDRLLRIRNYVDSLHYTVGQMADSKIREALKHDLDAATRVLGEEPKR